LTRPVKPRKIGARKSQAPQPAQPLPHLPKRRQNKRKAYILPSYNITQRPT